MKRFTRRFAILGSLAVAFGLISTNANAQTGGVTIPIVGNGGLLGNFAGQLTNVTVAVVNGVPTVLGTLSGQFANGTVINSLPIALPILGGNVNGTCTILDLTLGPLHLDLLGLVVDLNQIHLRITAQPGSGNLLGNLLCSVAHLLDTNAGGNAISNLLNRILGILGGL